MKKTFQLHVEGKHPDRLLEAIKHEIKDYLARERRKKLPAGQDFWDFDCRFGLSEDSAQVVHVATYLTHINQAAADKAPAFYIELLAKPARRQFVPRAPTAKADDSDDALQD